MGKRLTGARMQWRITFWGWPLCVAKLTASAPGSAEGHELKRGPGLDLGSFTRRPGVAGRRRMIDAEATIAACSFRFGALRTAYGTFLPFRGREQ
jgi:hypothetical protein